MATKKIFQEFNPISSSQWKQQIQYELKGADYNDTLVWESLEGIKVKPFYHTDEFEKKYSVEKQTKSFEITQNIFVHDAQKSNEKAIDALNRGAECIRFTLQNENIDANVLLKNLPKSATYIFVLPFLSIEYINALVQKLQEALLCASLSIDPIGQLAQDGNWFENLESDFKNINAIFKNVAIPFLSISSGVYQNAGANIVQQLAYTLAHLNEYLNRIDFSGQIKSDVIFTIEVSVGSNYFFEIAKLRALRILIDTLAKEYQDNIKFHILATPTKRNKTLYDYNVNMLRTTTECMSAILGEANAVANLAYDTIYHKDNEFGERIARNQLLILKHESYLDKVNNPAEGAYYIENLTQQLAEKALELFKEIEIGGGFITQLIEGKIQKKINESAQKEQDLFDAGKEVLLGTNKYPNKNDRMKDDLELYPFVKQNPRKTLITPIIEKRLAEKLEQERLNSE